MILPADETIMESLGMIYGWRMTEYVPEKERARYICSYCHKNLDYEDPSFEKHHGYCIYHPVNHGDPDAQSPVSAITIIKLDPGTNPSFSLDCKVRNVVPANGTDVRLYDRLETLNMNGINLNHGGEADKGITVLIPPTEGSRFNFNTGDIGVKMMMAYWKEHHLKKGQFFDLCWLCRKTRAAHRLLTTCPNCPQGPVCQQCFLQFVNEADDICKSCSPLVQGAFLTKGSFDPFLWIRSIQAS